MEVIGNALELKAFDRMEEDIRVIGYFKNKESERECWSFLSSLLVCVSCVYDRRACDRPSGALVLHECT